MTIEQGFRAVHSALFGPDPEKHPVGTCTRCGQDLVVCSLRGTAQPLHTYQFHLKGRIVGEDQQPLGILMGRLGLCFSWEADLCDDCVDCLGKWLRHRGLESA